MSILDAHFYSSIIPGKTTTISGCVGSSRAMIATQIALKGQPVLVITSDLKEATLWQQDIEFFSNRHLPILLFPPLDVLPYYQLSPNCDVIMDRLSVLWKLKSSRKPFILISPLLAFARKTIPQKQFLENSFGLAVLDSHDRETLIKKLLQLAYQRVPLVEDPGTFAVRGGIVDLFSPAHENPARLDFFGDTIESLRFFDPQTQKSTNAAIEIEIIPVREILFDPLEKNWISKLKSLSDQNDVIKTARDEIQQKIQNKIYFNGMESYINLFYQEPSTLFDFLPSETVVCCDHEQQLLAQLHLHHEELKKHRAKSTSVERIFSSEAIFLTGEEWKEWSGYFAKLDFGPQLGDAHATYLLQLESNKLLQQKIAPSHHREDALKPLALALDEKRILGTHLFIVNGSETQQQRVIDLLQRYALPLHLTKTNDETGRLIQAVLQNKTPSSLIHIVCGHLSEGFYWPELHQWWITDQEIFGEKVRQKAAPKSAGEAFTSFSDLFPGDYVVHATHGIGVYRGLLPLTIANIKNDFLLLQYLGGDKLYVPVDQLNKIFRYASEDASPPLLDKMGGASWLKTKEKVKRATRRLAHELLKLQAERLAVHGFAFSKKNNLFEEFEATFPYEETPDQLQAIEEVLKDMEQEKPMDRLVCGDVGYGKTEVAIRAAYKAVLDHKQVAILVPTTILAFQHYETFKKRFEQDAITIELLSRFQSKMEQKKIIEKLARRQIDVVIGTHRLISSDVKFGDLGLLVLDEEHRFGVAQKEKIKKIKSTVDVLTLSATPIPRTLNFALTGIRDLSLINTPPADRLSIRTYITHFDAATLHEAITREVRRGGQVFFVHNRIQTILQIKERLVKIVPDIKIEIAHGQIPEEKLEEVMIAFMHKKFDLLLCTSIIESGLDIPSANTIIINQADHFGLAQLYQLRGRVGRSHHRAYCYLLIPHDQLLTDSAKKRLDVLQRYTELGSGFKIASHDLEIRGAGNILGPEQSGQVAAVGYDLYIQLLEEAVMEQKGILKEEEIDPEIKIPLVASIPEDLVPDTQLRLVLYKQLSSVKTESDCLSLRDEWSDRFGKISEPVENLIQIMLVKILARPLKIVAITCQNKTFTYQIHPSSPIPTNYFIQKTKAQPKKYKILPEGRFVIVSSQPSEKDLVKQAKTHLLEMQTMI